MGKIIKRTKKYIIQDNSFTSLNGSRVPVYTVYDKNKVTKGSASSLAMAQKIASRIK